MGRKFLILSLVVLLTNAMNLRTEAAPLSPDNNISVHNHSNDFVTSLTKPTPSLPSDKNSLINKLDDLTKDIKNNSDMALAFNILLNSDVLTNKDKEEWWKKKISKLPSPFLLLGALFVEDLESAKALYVLSGARMLIDADMCQDISAKEGLTFVRFLIMPKIFERFGMEVNAPGSEKNIRKLHEIEKQFFKNGGYKKYDQKYATSFNFPYWLAYHGLFTMTKDDLSDTIFFKPVNEYEDIKENVFKELEGYASKRGGK